jgi:diguanylate cyclase (GGDEF)-like protein
VEARPLVIGRGGIDHVVGVILLGWRPDSASSDGTPGLLDALVDLAAVALDREHQAASQVERSEWLERLAHLDPLTGLANRRTFDRVLELEIARASRQRSEVSVAVFDVDAFREMNAAEGAGVGDDVLRAVAAVLAESVRLVDTVARIGGDEFVVVAPGAGGAVVAGRVIAALSATDQVAGRPVSVSAGVARFPADGTTAAELLSQALVALDAARAAGRASLVEALPSSASADG